MASASASAPAAAWTQGLRLPTNVVPLRYDVALAPNLTAFTFAGQLRLRLRVHAATSEIVTHSFELSYPTTQNARPNVHLFDAAGERMLQQAARVDLDEPSQRARFAFDGEFAAGEYTLSVAFDGILNDQLCGFYRSSYVSAITGKEKFMAITQFEATDCRRALPCFDEPAAKAVFAVTLIVEPGLVAVSNMPAIRTQTILQTAEEQHADPECRGIVVPRGYVRTVYADTPLMSSYLLAFIVGEFDYLSEFSEGTGCPGATRVELRVYTPTGQTKTGEFALMVAKKCLQLFENFFQIPYPLAKLDLIAAPDFASGAMENWGAITYRDTFLLIDPENSSALVRQRCAKTVAHEISHMWFGNLVTMQWWSALWLNEGFARYCESWAVDVIFPEWQVMDQFINEVYAVAQTLDGLESSHPIEQAVATPEEINEIFDIINYNKGASLVRMLLQTLGPAAFQKGLQHYLATFAYKNTTSTDLWNSFTHACAQLANGQPSIDVKAVMHLWTTEMNYPLIQVEQAPAHGKIGCQCFLIKQSKFLQSGKVGEAAASSALVPSADPVWSVPLAVGEYNTSSLKAVVVSQRILSQLQGVIEVTASDKSIFSFNHASTGFYRTLYSPALFAGLSSLVSQNVLPTLDRLALLRDCFALSTCGQGYTIANLLDLVLLFKSEESFTCLQMLSLIMQSLCTLHAGQAYAPQLQRLVAQLFAQRWAQLGWGPAPGTPEAKQQRHLDSLERGMLLQQLGGFNAELQAEAWVRLQAFAADQVKHAIQPDLRGPVYALAIKHAGAEARTLLQKLYVGSGSSEERVRILSSLGTTAAGDSVDEINVLLTWIFSSGHVRNGDLIYALSAVGQDSKLARDACWTYMKAHWEDLMSRFKGAMFVFGRILPSVIGEMSSVAEAEEFEHFFSSHPCVGAERSVKTSSETVRMKSARLEREKPLLAEWIAKNMA